MAHPLVTLGDVSLMNVEYHLGNLYLGQHVAVQLDKLGEDLVNFAQKPDLKNMTISALAGLATNLILSL